MAATLEGVCVFVRNDCVSRVIGKGGRKIKEIMTESGAHISVDRDQSKEERAVTIRGSPEAVEKAKKQILAITNHRHTPANEGQSFFENHKASRHPWHRSSEDQSQTDLPKDQQTWNGLMLPSDENWDLGMPDRSTFYIKDSGESLKEIPKNGWDDPQEEGQGGSQQEYSSWDSEHRDAGTTKNVQCYKCSAYGHISRNCTSNRWDEPQAQHGSHQEYSRDSEHREDKLCRGESEEEWCSITRKGRKASSGGRDAGTTKNVQCFRCSEYGHVRTDCPNNRGNRDVTCYKCGNAGHISRNCTNNNSQKKEPISWGQLPSSQETPSTGKEPAEPEEVELWSWNLPPEGKSRWDDMEPIVKNFYEEHPDVTRLSSTEVDEIRREKNNITVVSPGGEVPNPVQTFEEAFHQYPEILDEIYNQNFQEPSPIQCQAWPILLSGKNLIGIAQTGTGKTLAFLLPALIHIDGQPKPREERGGPTVLILSPTRELALQIEEEVQKINYKGIRSVCVYGGGNRKHQIELVLSGVEIVVATPGRLSDLTCNGHLRLNSVSFMVLDEADRMLDEGFEYDIRKIMIDIRPDAQMAMTSATWPMGVRNIADRYMKDAIRVNVGSLDLAAVHTVTQYVEVMTYEEKKPRLFEIMETLRPEDKVIVFCGRKAVADDVSSDLVCKDIGCEAMHGDMAQEERVASLARFKSGETRIMVATDLAARGLDVKDITIVINFDFPRNIEEYVHRIGRTGRAGQEGSSVTFMMWEDGRHAKEVVKIMTEANQNVPPDLQRMADRYVPRPQRGRGRGRGRGGFGGGKRF